MKQYLIISLCLISCSHQIIVHQFRQEIPSEIPIVVAQSTIQDATIPEWDGQVLKTWGVRAIEETKTIETSRQNIDTLINSNECKCEIGDPICPCITEDNK